MRDWTRRAVVSASAGIAGLAAMPARADALTSLIQDGTDGVLCAGVIARRGDGTIKLAASTGRRLSGPGPHPAMSAFGLDDPFRVASVSKMIAAAGFMRLVERGRVHLEDDAAAHLGFRLRHPGYPDRPILVRHLLSHTSALRNGPSYPVPAGHRLREAFEPEGRHWDGGAWFGPPGKAPGDWFAYADVNFCLIAQIIERLTGQRFDHYMTGAVLKPLGLDAGYNWSGVSQAKRDRAATARRWLNGQWTIQTDDPVPRAPAAIFTQPGDGPPLAEAELPLGENGFLFSPQGGLRVSLRDMDALAMMFRHRGALAGARIITPASLARMETPVWRFDPDHPNGETGEGGADDGVFGGYGLGVEIPQARHANAGDPFFGSGSEHWRGHLGDAYGWMTGLFWNLRDGRTVVWAANGMRETDRPKGRRSALTPAEETLIDLGMAAAG